MAAIKPLSSVSAARPYSADVVAGQTGTGSLSSRGTPLAPQKLGVQAKNRNITPGFQQEPYPAPYDAFDDGFDYILPGTLTNPDQTPRTHATPFAGHVGNYMDGDAMSALNANVMEIHSEDFGALKQRTHSSRNTSAYDPATVTRNTGIGESNLQPLTGQVRRNAGYDAVQGYGGRGSGPGGINAAPTGKGVQVRFSNPQPTYSLVPSERPFIAPQGGYNAQFTDAVQGPERPYGWSFGDAASPYDPASAYAPPAEVSVFKSGYVEGPIV